jgi:hypothetical protein
MFKQASKIKYYVSASAQTKLARYTGFHKLPMRAIRLDPVDRSRHTAPRASKLTRWYEHPENDVDELTGHDIEVQRPLEPFVQQ